MQRNTLACVAVACLYSLLASGCVGRLTAPTSADARPLALWGYTHAATASTPHDGPSFSSITYQRLFETLHDVYGEPFLFVVTSAAEWRDYHQKMLEQGGLIVYPPPEPPAGVNWETDAVLIAGMRSAAAAYTVHIDSLARRGSHLLADIDIDWAQRLDPIEYSPTDMVKFATWPGLKGTCAIGDQVIEALQAISLNAQ